jgi:hypothetical protein
MKPWSTLFAKSVIKSKLVDPSDYYRASLQPALRGICRQIKVEIVKRSDAGSV